MFKDDAPISSFKQWNHQLRQIFDTDDWDSELELLSELKGLFGIRADSATNDKATLNDEDDEEQEDDDELNQELVCSQPLAPRQLNF